MTSLPTQDAFTFSRADFPEDFWFAVATSAYQIEGHSFGGAGPTHWDAFAAIPGRVERGETGAVACDHVHRWKEDLDLIAAAGLDAYRFSTSWARVMPDGVNVNPEGIDFYDRLVDGMLARGLRPMATLYHWELPQALSEAGGWQVRDTPARFAEFAALIAKVLGDRLHSVAPINEPWCVAWLSHFEGHHAPGLRDLSAAAKAMHHVALAHGLAVSALRSRGIGQVGAVCNLEYAIPGSDAPQDQRAAKLYDGIYNRWFMGAMIQGAYPDDVLDGLAPYLPTDWQNDLSIISQPIDWMGINYYTCARIYGAIDAFPFYQKRPGPPPLTDIGWEVSPDGFEWLLRRAQRDYTGPLPLAITENGMANADRSGRPDLARIAYLDSHIARVKTLISEGVPIEGFTIWSLLDNYEWAFGYGKRFGLVHVDFESLARTPKASYHALAHALRR